MEEFTISHLSVCRHINATIASKNHNYKTARRRNKGVEPYIYSGTQSGRFFTIGRDIDAHKILRR